VQEIKENITAGYGFWLRQNARELLQDKNDENWTGVILKAIIRHGTWETTPPPFVSRHCVIVDLHAKTHKQHYKASRCDHNQHHVIYTPVPTLRKRF